MFNFFKGFLNGSFFPFKVQETKEEEKDIFYWWGFLAGLDGDDGEDE